jgi:hypothetical protein
VREVEEVAMSRRVRPDVVRRRLLALLDPIRSVPEWPVERSPEWRAGYVAGMRTAREVIRKG